MITRWSFFIEVMMNRQYGGLGPICQVAFAQDVANVRGGGVAADEQFFGDLPVGLASGQ